MLTRTHVVFSLILVGEEMFAVNTPFDVGVLTFAAVGSVLPDIDTTRSTVGAVFAPISRRIETRFGHRTITHSAVFLLFLSVAVLFIAATYGWKYYFALLLGTLGHIMGDQVTITGCQFFWPNKASCVAWLDQRFRFRTGSVKEHVVLACLLLAFGFLLPIYSLSLRTTIYLTSRNLPQAITYIQEMINTNRIYVTMEGSWLDLSKGEGGSVDPSERFEVIKMIPMGIYLQSLDHPERVIFASLANRSDVLVNSIYVEVGEPVRRVHNVIRVTAGYLGNPAEIVSKRTDIDRAVIDGWIDIQEEEEAVESEFSDLFMTVDLKFKTISLQKIGSNLYRLRFEYAPGPLVKRVFEGKSLQISGGSLAVLTTEPVVGTVTETILQRRLLY